MTRGFDISASWLTVTAVTTCTAKSATSAHDIQTTKRFQPRIGEARYSAISIAVLLVISVAFTRSATRSAPKTNPNMRS